MVGLRNMLKGLVDASRVQFWRLAASGLLPKPLILGRLASGPSRQARTGSLRIEIVSHCWNYSHLLVYQLSSLVLAPPEHVEITVTVFHAREDAATKALLDFIAGHAVPGVHWNWQELPPQYLFRRSIGRNRAALQSEADWIWFTDCDVVFEPGCLDSLAEALQGRSDPLVFPRYERVTTLLADDDAMLKPESEWILRDIDPTRFVERKLSRATGPVQITHGDVARSVGYCRDISVLQQPVPRFAKCYEDRVFRWLLGTRGVPIDVDGVYRIRHEQKGRYHEGVDARLRRTVRKVQEWRAKR